MHHQAHTGQISGNAQQIAWNSILAIIQTMCVCLCVSVDYTIIKKNTVDVIL